MKKINLLKPELVTGYLEEGKGQEITYLSVNPGMSSRKLGEDIKNGATYLKEVLEISKKKPSRFVVIKCKTKEEGLIAVSYLSSIYNMQENVCWDSESDGTAHDVSSEQEDSYEDYSGEDEMTEFDPEEVGYDFDKVFSTDADDEWQSGQVWEENPWRIPVISSNDLYRDDENPMNAVFGADRAYGTLGIGNNKVPYWRYTRRENICVFLDTTPSVFDGGTYLTERSFKRYESNRHVFLLIIDKFAYERNAEAEFADEDDEYSYNPERWYEPIVARLVLDNSAEIISIHHSEEELMPYYINLFENWVDEFGYSLANGFPISDVTERIIGMADDSKSRLFEKVVRYATRNIDEARQLNEEDFNVLYKLKGLGFRSGEKDKEHFNIKKLENSLVGMEDIKDQIRNIVDVFNYNKLRNRMGLKNGTYHNVHMMLGAPGTAKTTVAQILGNIMAEEKLLRGNRFISVNGAELKGMYVGHSAPKVKKLFDENDIIFIDEAYSVCAGADGQDDSFSQEAIAQLIIELEKHGMDRLVVFAGYGGPNVSANDNKMMSFLKSNPGIRSRINSTLFFDSYDADQMTGIFRGLAKNGEYSIPKAADSFIRAFFASRTGSPDFGNGREARSLLENASAEAAKRLSKIPSKDLTKELLKQIKTEDIKRAIDRMERSYEIQSGIRRSKLGF